MIGQKQAPGLLFQELRSRHLGRGRNYAGATSQGSALGSCSQKTSRQSAGEIRGLFIRHAEQHELGASKEGPLLLIADPNYNTLTDRFPGMYHPSSHPQVQSLNPGRWSLDFLLVFLVAGLAAF